MKYKHRHQPDYNTDSRQGSTESWGIQWTASDKVTHYVWFDSCIIIETIVQGYQIPVFASNIAIICGDSIVSVSSSVATTFTEYWTPSFRLLTVQFKAVIFVHSRTAVSFK